MENRLLLCFLFWEQKQNKYVHKQSHWWRNIENGDAKIDDDEDDDPDDDD